MGIELREPTGRSTSEDTVDRPPDLKGKVKRAVPDHIGEAAIVKLPVIMIMVPR
jgi:hypothetical protein